MLFAIAVVEATEATGLRRMCRRDVGNAVLAALSNQAEPPQFPIATSTRSPTTRAGKLRTGSTMGAERGSPVRMSTRP